MGVLITWMLSFNMLAAHLVFSAQVKRHSIEEEGVLEVADQPEE
jgi:hypothetical protein